MLHERWGSVTRRAALALLPWLGLATAGPGCSPARPASSGVAGTLDRLERMRARRGTGDPRLRGKRRPSAASGIRTSATRFSPRVADGPISPRRHQGPARGPLTSL
jgi:hypothetical protein